MIQTVLIGCHNLLSEHQKQNIVFAFISNIKEQQKLGELFIQSRCGSDMTLTETQITFFEFETEHTCRYLRYIITAISHHFLFHAWRMNRKRQSLPVFFNSADEKPKKTQIYQDLWRLKGCTCTVQCTS